MDKVLPVPSDRDCEGMEMTLHYRDGCTYIVKALCHYGYRDVANNV